MACGCSGSVDASAGLTAAALNARGTPMPRFKVVTIDGQAEIFDAYIDALRFKMTHAGSDLSELR